MVNNLLHTVGARIATLIGLPGMAIYGPALPADRKGDTIQKASTPNGSIDEVNPNGFGALFWVISNQSFNQEEGYGKGTANSIIDADLYIITGEGCAFGIPSKLSADLNPSFSSTGEGWSKAVVTIESAQFGPQQLGGLFSPNVTNKLQTKDITKISISIKTQICTQC